MGAVAWSRDPSSWIPSPADEVAFRNGLAKLASGVAIVACWADGQPRGLLVNSLTGLSTQPPRLLFCVRKAAGAHAALLKADFISVSLLDYYDLGVTTFLIRGFDPLEDATDYGRELIPRTRELVAQRAASVRKAA